MKKGKLISLFYPSFFKNMAKKYSVPLAFAIFFVMAIFCFSLAKAETVNSSSVSDNQLSIENIDLTDETEALEGISIDEPTSIPSNFGLWWRSLRERISIALSLDPVKKAEKQLKFAEERLKLAEYIIENSSDPKIQEKAQQMLEKANEFMEKIQARKDEFANNPDERGRVLLRNIARHQVNQERVLEKMEDKWTPEKIEAFQEFRQRIENRAENFLENIQNNANIPEEIKNKILEAVATIQNRIEERVEFRAEQKELLDKIKQGNEQAKEDFEKLRQERKEKIEQLRREFFQKKEELINQIESGEKEAINALKNLNQEWVREKNEVKEQIQEMVNEIKQEREQNREQIQEQIQENKNSGQQTATTTKGR